MIVFKPFGYLLAAIRFAIIIGTMAVLIGIGLMLMKLKLANQELALPFECIGVKWPCGYWV